MGDDSFQDAIPNGGIQQRAHGAEKSIDLNQKRTTDGFKRESREMAAGRANFGPVWYRLRHVVARHASIDYEEVLA